MGKTIQKCKCGDNVAMVEITGVKRIWEGKIKYVCPACNKINEMSLT